MKKAAPAKTDNKLEIVEAVKYLAKEKGISEDVLFSAVEDALKTAFRKNQVKGVVTPTNIAVQLDRKTGEMHIWARKLIVEEVEDPAGQITLDEAKALNSTYVMGDIAEQDVTPTGFLRVAAQSAKQGIIQRIRYAEQGKIYDEYIEKESEILTAIVQRVEPKAAYLELGRTEGILETSEMMKTEVLRDGDHVKVYVLEVLRNMLSGSGQPQVRVSRIHPNLVKRLFEMEVPEIAAGDVVIKSIAREAGSRTKMAVHSNFSQIDPVGACVGQRGSRVDRVVGELKGEKIDIIKWSSDPAEFVANALNPAHVLAVFVADNEKSCRVVVPDNQLSLAIGKDGQNARLAAKLTGWKIDIKSQSQAAEMTDMVDEMAMAMPQMEMPAAAPASTFDRFIDEKVTLSPDEDDTL